MKEKGSNEQNRQKHAPSSPGTFSCITAHPNALNTSIHFTDSCRPNPTRVLFNPVHTALFFKAPISGRSSRSQAFFSSFFLHSFLLYSFLLYSIPHKTLFVIVRRDLLEASFSFFFCQDTTISSIRPIYWIWDTPSYHRKKKKDS
jgi:hypothetical protein